MEETFDGPVVPHLRAGGSSSSSQAQPRKPEPEKEKVAEMKDAPIECVLTFEELTVLCEPRVDFDNLELHGVNLKAEVAALGWERYFNRLPGPVYVKLVKEFWRKATCNDVQITSYILGQKIVITEISIAKLLGMENKRRKRFTNVDNQIRLVQKYANPHLFGNKVPKSDCKTKDLSAKMKVWHKILLMCINPRPTSNSPNYMNATQKCMLYYLDIKFKLCLPYFLFQYLKDAIKKSRTTTTSDKASIKYIPFGRMLSDIFIENGLVKFQKNSNCLDDLTVATGEAINVKTLSNMKLIEKIIVKPFKESPDELALRRIYVDGYPLWSKEDSPEAIVEYLNSLKDEGVDVDPEVFIRNLPETSSAEPPRKKKSKVETSEGDKKAKKKSIVPTTTSEPTDVTLRNYSPTTSKDFVFSQPKNPAIQSPSDPPIQDQMIVDQASEHLHSEAKTSAPVTSKASSSTLKRTPSNQALISFSSLEPHNLLEFLNCMTIEANIMIRNLLQELALAGIRRREEEENAALQVALEDELAEWIQAEAHYENVACEEGTRLAALLKKGKAPQMDSEPSGSASAQISSSIQIAPSASASPDLSAVAQQLASFQERFDKQEVFNKSVEAMFADILKRLPDPKP
ncbi:uncharacterized protein LOC130736384 [Lotus japonicus]|uniref:uncharacterized protein LOC130736384 n=1 Tax=Lotus japonicus TaxID=34305 RepID=UPI00258512D7|nr:uncharacterized protein LOC130736384 [Lotus japonicus]